MSASKQTILVTGSTDGLGLEAAKMMYSFGHHVLLHGRSAAKLEAAEKAVMEVPGGGKVDSYLADLSNMDDVEALAKAITEKHSKLDVLVNNAGVFQTPTTVTKDGLDVRFAVNTIAPYLLTQRLLSIIGTSGRIINVASAAQAPVDLNAVRAAVQQSHMAAYAQSKLAITMWSRNLALSLQEKGGPVVIALNPGSMLGSKMVKEAFGVAGGDMRIGADIITRTALDDEFASHSGEYFDNDAGNFGPPHSDALDAAKSEELVRVIEKVLADLKH